MEGIRCILSVDDGMQGHVVTEKRTHGGGDLVSPPQEFLGRDVGAVVGHVEDLRIEGQPVESHHEALPSHHALAVRPEF